MLVSAFAVVRHAESLAHHYGEPYGTLILTLSAVAIEVLMISAMMLNEDPDPSLGRDTIYATLMIIVNGLIGLAMLLGGLRYGEQQYNLKSSTAFFSMILVLAAVGLYLPVVVPGDVPDHVRGVPDRPVVPSVPSVPPDPDQGASLLLRERAVPGRAPRRVMRTTARPAGITPSCSWAPSP